MTVQEIIPIVSAEVLTPGQDLGREVKGGFCCDLLSWVMGRAQADSVLITVQTSLNVVAVATLKDLSAIIIPESTQVEPDTLKKAEQEDVIMLSSPLTSYEICGLLYQNGVRA